MYGANAQRLLRAHRVMHLPRAPGRSDIEVSVDAPWTLLLSEDAEQTLQGVINSTKVLIETTATDLLNFWLWRRENPRILQQPATQWLNGRSTESKGFQRLPARDPSTRTKYGDGAPCRRTPISLGRSGRRSIDGSRPSLSPQKHFSRSLFNRMIKDVIMR